MDPQIELGYFQAVLKMIFSKRLLRNNLYLTLISIFCYINKQFLNIHYGLEVSQEAIDPDFKELALLDETVG